MKKISTVRVNGKMIFKGHKLTIGVDLGDRWSSYCVLDEAGKVCGPYWGLVESLDLSRRNLHKLRKAVNPRFSGFSDDAQQRVTT
jgi:hypothetical protein